MVKSAINRVPGVHSALKAKQRKLREAFPESLGLRVHRALSWLERAEKEGDDPDAAVIFLWIAFNAVYGGEKAATKGAPGRNPSERNAFFDFFTGMLKVDSRNRIYDAVWQKFSGPVRMLLDNQYIFQPFWDHHSGRTGTDWKSQFARSRKRAHDALREKDTRVVLSILFDRLYVLRNQLIHGGATWNGKVNRAQVRDGAGILAFLIPVFIELMMDNPERDWGKTLFPVVPQDVA